MEPIFTGTKAAIDINSAQEIEISGPATLVAGKLKPSNGGVTESVVAYIKTLSGDFELIQPQIVLTHNKNTDVITGSGTFKFVKTATQEDVDLGYE